MKATKMGTTFDNFALLPAELRLKIWRQAIPDGSVPWAHLFHMSHTSEHLTYTMPATCTAHHAAALPFPANSGLWGSCIESRSVIMRKFPIDAKLGGPIAHELSQSGVQVVNAAERFTDHRSAARQYTVVPEKDLLVLDAAVFRQNLPWILDAASPWWMVSHSFAGYPNVAHADAAHVAIKIHPLWTNPKFFNKSHFERQIEHIKGVGLDLYHNATLYFIDYGLRRQRTLDSCEPPADRKTFRVMGGRFIEVIDNGEWAHPFAIEVRSPYNLFGIMSLKTPTRVCSWNPVMRHVKHNARTVLLAWESD